MTDNTEQPIAAQADTTNDLVADDSAVSRTEHAIGSRQPDDGTVITDEPNLTGRAIPQEIITAENDTPTPGEDK